MEAANWATTPGVFRPLTKNIECAITLFERDPSCYAADLPPLRVESIKDMVDGVTRFCSFTKGGVATLRIIGHGTPTYMNIGRNVIGHVSDVQPIVDVQVQPTTRAQDLPPMPKRLRLKEYSIELVRLYPYFCEGARVVLEGCQIGKNEELIKEVSLLWPGVTVKRAKPILKWCWHLPLRQETCISTDGTA